MIDVGERKDQRRKEIVYFSCILFALILLIIWTVDKMAEAGNWHHEVRFICQIFTETLSKCFNKTGMLF